VSDDETDRLSKPRLGSAGRAGGLGCGIGFGVLSALALHRSTSSWQVTAWGLLVALPISVPLTVGALLESSPIHPTASSIAGFAYVGTISTFVGFFAWYRGLAEAGVAKASQLQLLQPLLTIAWSVPVLGDRLDPISLFTALIVGVCVLVTQRAPNERAPRVRKRRPPRSAPRSGPRSAPAWPEAR
jgi:drug/metabolite transporter (DMT)-like permease